MTPNSKNFHLEYPIVRLEKKNLAELSSFAHDIFKTTYEDKLIGKFEKENFQVYLKKAFSNSQLSKELNDVKVEYFGIFIHDKLEAYLKLNHPGSQSLLKPKNYLEIERFYVSTKQQGRGLGRYLFEWTKAWALSNAYDVIWLRSWERNDKAIEFYKKVGLKIVATAEYKFEESNDIDYVFELALK